MRQWIALAAVAVVAASAALSAAQGSCEHSPAWILVTVTETDLRRRSAR